MSIVLGREKAWKDQVQYKRNLKKQVDSNVFLPSYPNFTFEMLMNFIPIPAIHSHYPIIISHFVSSMIICFLLGSLVWEIGTVSLYSQHGHMHIDHRYLGGDSNKHKVSRSTRRGENKTIGTLSTAYSTHDIKKRDREILVKSKPRGVSFLCLFSNYSAWLRRVRSGLSN